MTADPDQPTFWKTLAEGFWDHFWTCWAVIQPQVAALFWFVWRRPRESWHWLVLIPSGIVAIALILLPIAALVAAGSEKFGWGLGDLWPALTTFLDRKVFLSPKIWQVLLFVAICFAVGLFWLLRRRSSPDSTDESDPSETANLVDSPVDSPPPPTEPNVEVEDPAGSLPPTRVQSTQRVRVVGVEWVEGEGGGEPTPLCPHCNRPMGLRPEPNPRGMAIAPVRPKNMILECGRPGCPQGKIPTNLTKPAVMRAVRDALEAL